MSLTKKIILSWLNTEGSVNTTESLLDWIREQNNTVHVKIEQESINNDTFWFYDDYNGEVLNRKRSFFSIKGIHLFKNSELLREQPIIIQPEIGYLGIICREINGVLNFLMQAKIEPGNVNCVQISPTIQATKSNFTRAHGGKFPPYFELFETPERFGFQIIYDQIQSEQATRFYKKRNRNIIMFANKDFEIYPSFRWMTLGQIKELMDYDNLVNMDTRTVLSGIPLAIQRISDNEKKELAGLFRDQALFKSVFCMNLQDTLPKIYCRLNDYKMFSDINVTAIPLRQLVDWTIDDYGITCKKQADFMVRYYDIEISSREVQHWSQPLFKAIGMATFGLISRVTNEKRQYLVRIKPEIGSFDQAEIGPSIQWEPTHCSDNDNDIDKVFRSKYKNRQGIITDVVLSEEGGRFFHEQNHNVIIEINEEELPAVLDDYIWVDYATLNFLVQINNCLNIQLRNLLSLIKL